MGGKMLWFITLEENFCKVFIRKEGQWLLALCCSQADLSPLFYSQSPYALFVRRELRPYLLDLFFFVNATFKVDMVFDETKIEKLGSMCFVHPFLHLYVFRHIKILRTFRYKIGFYMRSIKIFKALCGKIPPLASPPTLSRTPRNKQSHRKGSLPSAIMTSWRNPNNESSSKQELVQSARRQKYILTYTIPIRSTETPIYIQYSV